MVLISIIYIFMIKRKEMHKMRPRGLACEEYDLKRQDLEEMRV